MDISLFYVVVLLVVGFLAGVINILAGGGSNLTLPALMMMGLPADMANGTNRVAVLVQCVVGAKSFRNHDMLDTSDIKSILIPTLIGGAVGAAAASVIPNFYLKPVLIGTMVAMALLILLRPSVVIPEEGTPTVKVSNSPKAWLALFVAGLYGGFVQAGVGFILIAALAGTLRYDLVRVNALKVLCAAVFTAVALLVFVVQGQVVWLPGIILAIGTTAGALVGVRLALKVSQKSLKWFLFVMTLVAGGAALLY